MRLLRITTPASSTTAASAARLATTGTAALDDEPPVLGCAAEPQGEQDPASDALPAHGSPWQPAQVRRRVLLQLTEHADHLPQEAHSRARPAVQMSTMEAMPSQAGP